MTGVDVVEGAKCTGCDRQTRCAHVEAQDPEHVGQYVELDFCKRCLETMRRKLEGE